ncbi:Sam dependent methyltransferase [Neofusicoccum parvum]|uniref:Sam dependent methyltransferase n=2 Tax=Neofusicoccum parvum TaxID=310453 RepID=A0ACB5SJY6_9PEZI|nr:putative sam dependent methyltransferase protein [Neofusicoccum parvum UCRNP2]GME41888.1 Sam dependent methyltransferase [Neofusicoccum parvum]GME44983.1 Sam dependent methyltransferase [Neofusicoccum parvum]
MEAGISHPILVDEDYDADSALGDDALSDTTSIASSIDKHRYEHGRRYHKYQEGAYWGPNDDAQNDQLDIGHHMYKILLDDKLLLAPIGDNDQKVLDVGCGTGIWAIDFAEEYPDSDVTGIDLSPIQPSLLPSNCHFVVDDCTKPWSFPEDYFDLVHVRALFGSVADWPAFYKEALSHLKPGGWISQLEINIVPRSDDGSLTPDHTLLEWAALFIEASERFGKSFMVVENMKQEIVDAGFVEVEEVRFKVPLGPWPSDPRLKELGKWDLLYCYQGCEGWALYLLTHVMGWKVEEVKALVARYKEALRDPKLHSYWEL